MDVLENSATTLLTAGKSTRPKSITLFVTTLLLAMVVGSVAARAQTATLVVTAIDAGRFYGDPNPAFTANITGLRAGDNITAVFSTVADPTSPVGDYLIVPTLVDPDNKLGNYTVVTNEGTLTVSAAALSVTPADATRLYGAANPALSGTVVGLQNSDNITANYASTATATSPVGDYPITATLNDPDTKLGNYSVTLHSGALSVTKAPLDVTAASAAFPPPGTPASPATAKAHRGSDMFRFLFVRARVAACKATP